MSKVQTQDWFKIEDLPDEFDNPIIIYYTTGHMACYQDHNEIEDSLHGALVWTYAPVYQVEVPSGWYTPEEYNPEDFEQVVILHKNGTYHPATYINRALRNHTHLFSLKKDVAAWVPLETLVQSFNNPPKGITWRSIKGEIPAAYINVLIKTTEGKIYQAYHQPGDKWYSGEETIPFTDVTHWMYLFEL